jgi:hypothetical protein
MPQVTEHLHTKHKYCHKKRKAYQQPLLGCKHLLYISYKINYLFPLYTHIINKFTEL